MLSRFFLDRPVFAWVIAIAMMLGGASPSISCPSPSTADRPALDRHPGSYTGASARRGRQRRPDHRAADDRARQDIYMHSTADSSGMAAVELTFAPGTDPDLAWAKVQNKLQLAMPSLPSPSSARAGGREVDAHYLIMIGLTTDDGSMSQEDLMDYIITRVQPVIARVPGVGEAETFGTATHAGLVRPRQAHQLRDDVQRGGGRHPGLQRGGLAGQLGGAPRCRASASTPPS